MKKTSGRRQTIDMTLKGMKIFVCGSMYEEEVSDSTERELIRSASRELGAQLFKRGAALVVGTDIEQSIDRFIVDGAIEELDPSPGRCLEIEVYYLESSTLPFKNFRANKQVSVKYHKIPATEWHVAHMAAIDSCDCVVLLSGRNGTLVAGLLAMLKGVPIAPIAAFGGTAKDVFEMALKDKRRNPSLLDELFLDALKGPWIPELSASAVADAIPELLRIHRLTNSESNAGPMAFSTVIIVAILFFGGCVSWPYLFTSADTHIVSLGFIVLFVTCLSAAVIGVCANELLRHDVKEFVTWSAAIIHSFRGFAIGFIAFLMLPALEAVATGSVSVELEQNQFMRYLIAGSAVGAFGGFRTNVLLEWFADIVQGKRDLSDSQSSPK